MTQNRAVADVVALEDLRALAAARQPCITAALNIPDPLQLRARIANLIRDLEKRISDDGIDPATGAGLMQPIREAAATIDSDGLWSAALILFRAPDLFLRYITPPLRSGLIAVGRRFQIRPVLQLLGMQQRFAVLALNQKHVRLFLCTMRTCEEVGLVGRAPRNLLQWMNTDPPDHLLANRSTGGRAGSMKGVVFTTSADREKHGEYLRHFFKGIDAALPKLLDGGGIPLVVFGVEYENVLYREVSEYPNLEVLIDGSPDGLTPTQVHTRATEIMARRHSSPLRKTLADLEILGGTARTLEKPEAIVKAAFEGRVSDLLIREDAEYRGVFNEATVRVEGGPDSPGSEDLLNYAALLTLAHGGRAYVAGAPEMPARAGTTAIVRF